MASTIRRWLGRELVIGGRRLYIVDDGTLAGGEAAPTPLDHMFGSFLRTRSGRSPEPGSIQGWSLAQKKVALEAIVKCQSRLSGIDVMDKSQLARFLAETRAAVSRDALDQLAQSFTMKWHEANYLAYVHLRASASATVL
ncbi:MAG: hypothetical protein EPO10_06775 [Reyranella sp.]|nr:MAG: hypothetical protein EPO10_06775 [Reyranella sp.]